MVIPLVNAAIGSRVVSNRLGNILDLVVTGQAESFIIGVGKEPQNQESVNDKQFDHHSSSIA
jgi:hypothetical protein